MPKHLRKRDETRIAGVYALVHKDTGMRYVGSSLDVTARLIAHARELRAGTHHARPLQAAHDHLGGLGAFEVHLLAGGQAVSHPARMADAEQNAIEQFRNELLNGVVAQGVTRYRKVRKVWRARLCTAAITKQAARCSAMWTLLQSEGE